MFQLIHEWCQGFFRMRFYHLAIKVNNNTGNDRQYEHGIDGEKDGTYFSDEGDSDHISESGSRDYSITVPEGINVTVDIRFYDLDDQCCRK